MTDLKKLNSGQQFEMDVLGSYADFKIVPEYQLFNKTIALTLNIQPFGWDPTNPSTELGKQLVTSIRKLLISKLESMNYRKDFAESVGSTLGLYVAVNTPLDFYHGMDALVAFDLGVCPLYVAVDLKVNNYNGDEKSKKACLILSRHDFNDFDHSKFCSRIVQDLIDVLRKYLSY